MKAQKSTLLTVAGALVLATGLVAAQSNPGAPVTQKPAPARPSDEGAKPAPAKLVNPVRGEAQIQFLNPVVKAEGNMIITTIKVKNLSPAPIAGFKVDEFWYDKGGQPATGAQTFRSPKPIQPGQVIDVVLRVQRVPGMAEMRNQYRFEHANGTVKPTRVPKF
jgi:hypothetical protein